MVNGVMDDGDCLVCIETYLGNIFLRLYRDTPIHRDNFLKLVKEGFYNGLLFHRVIKGFMIQGGDPDSKGVLSDRVLGSGDLGYTLPAEFVYPKYFHKRGALSAARMGDNVNPERASSASQFYIVWGEVYSSGQLDGFEQQRFSALQRDIFNRLQMECKDRIAELYKGGCKEELRMLREELIAKMEFESEQRRGEILMTPEQRRVYSEVGGTPHLDGAYTVFGEVVEGLDVVERIQLVDTDRFDRPLKDVSMCMTVGER